MTIRQLAEKLNTLSQNYEFGQLVSIRKQTKNLQKLDRNIFATKTIKDNYAFHNGGRREIQFNFGYEIERNLFRYGIAFSLKRDKTLRNPLETMTPRIQRFNSHIERNKKYYSDFYMWCDAYKGMKSKILNISKIKKEFIEIGNFIFLGKYIDNKGRNFSNEEIQEILKTFDRLMPLYRYVELTEEQKKWFKFKFKPGINKGKTTIIRSQTQNRKKITLQHKEMIENVYNQLVEKYGYDNVGTENNTGYGTEVDLVLKKNNSYVFYEFKTAQSVRDVIRQALSQLMEYCFYPSNNNASKLIIISTNKINPEAQKYLVLLRSKFKIPIYYQEYNRFEKKLELKKY